MICWQTDFSISIKGKYFKFSITIDWNVWLTYLLIGWLIEELVAIKIWILSLNNIKHVWWVDWFKNKMIEFDDWVRIMTDSFKDKLLHHESLID